MKIITPVEQDRHRNGARTRRRAEARQRICEWNGHSYVAKNSRGKYCPEHAPERIRSTASVTTPFTALDGEGQVHRCLEPGCPCLQYAHVCENTEEECITRGLHELCSQCGHRMYVNDFKESGGHAHTYPLLGVGKEQLCHEDGTDLQWWEIYDFLYRQFLAAPSHTAFVGFSLGYDFTMWHKTMRKDRYEMLIDPDRRRKTKTSRQSGNNDPFPMQIFAPQNVKCPVSIRDGGIEWQWQADMLGNHKRLRIRPQPCSCKSTCCEHMRGIYYMYICDVFPFFQKSFMSVIADIPGIPDDVREELQRGKDNRATAVLSETMKYYNQLENETLANHVMPRLDEGFRQMEVRLNKDQWYGPGQAAQKWLAGTKNKRRASRRIDVYPTLPDDLLQAIPYSYMAGWWDIFAHGHIPGGSHIYDINSAYPKIISELPCMGRYLPDGTFEPHGKWVLHQRGTKPVDIKEMIWYTGQFVLVNGIVHGTDPYIGAMMRRDKNGHLSRPHVVTGWFWLDEIMSSRYAGLIDQGKFTDWWVYEPTCECPSPLREVTDLYRLRCEVGKDNPLGMAVRLVLNSLYGKTAQTIGESPKYQNLIYASLITSGCRSQILNAIGSHPHGSKDILMVATDAFASKHEHTGLRISNELGDWSHKTKHNLTLAKPGFYWDDDSREALAHGRTLKSKQRGISAEVFRKGLPMFDQQFDGWRGPNEDGTGWPKVTLELGFSMMTAKQALRQNHWDHAGKVVNGRIEIDTASNMRVKRYPSWFDEEYGIYRSQPKPWDDDDLLSYPHDPRRSVTYQREFGLRESGMTPDGDWGLLAAEALGLK